MSKVLLWLTNLEINSNNWFSKINKGRTNKLTNLPLRPCQLSQLQILFFLTTWAPHIQIQQILTRKTSFPTPVTLFSITTEGNSNSLQFVGTKWEREFASCVLGLIIWSEIALCMVSNILFLSNVNVLAFISHLVLPTRHPPRVPSFTAKIGPRRCRI